MKNLVMTVAAATTMLFAAQNINAQEKTGEVAMNQMEAQVPADGYEKIEISELPVTVTKAIETDKAGSEVTEAWVDAEKKTFKLTLTAEGEEAETAYINAAGEWVEPNE